MTFEVEFFVKTRPMSVPKNELIESFEIDIDAGSYTEAQHKAFAIMKQANTFEDLMNKLNNEADPKKGNGK